MLLFCFCFCLASDQKRSLLRSGNDLLMAAVICFLSLVLE